MLLCHILRCHTVSEDPDQFKNLIDTLMERLPGPIIKAATLPVLQEVKSEIEEFYFGNSSSFRDTVLGFVDVSSQFMSEVRL